MSKRTKFAYYIVFVLAFCSVIGYAASRHTRSNAPTRFSATIVEGETLTKTISCYDPDGDPVTMTVEDLPLGAEVAAQVTQAGDYVDPDLPVVPDAPDAVWYTREFSWTPTFEQAGTYVFYIHAVDDQGDDDWVKYTITVTNTNRPPVL